jgi:hypothetical protein
MGFLLACLKHRNRVENSFAVGQTAYAEILQVVIGDLWKEVEVNAVLCECFDVLFELQGLEPLLDIAVQVALPQHRASMQLNILTS